MSEHRKYMEKMIGYPAKAGFCEPVEGFGERPQDAYLAMRQMSDEIVSLRTQLQQAEARVAELEKAGDLLCDELRQWQATEHDQDSLAAMAYWRDIRSLSGSDAFILRQQAEAAEEGIVYALRTVGNVDPFEVNIHKFANDYAQRLRQQADELDAGKAGGGS